MRRVFAAVLVLGLVGWIVPATQAQILTPAGLAAGLSGLSLLQPKVEQPKGDQPKVEQPKDGKPIKEQPKSEQTKPETIKEQPKPLPPQPQAQQYYERVVTCYKPQMTVREVKCVVTKMVPREEKYTCTVLVPMVRDEKRIETFYVPEQRPVEYTVTVMVPITTKEKRKVTECNFVETVVDCPYTVMVPRVTKQTRLVCYTDVERRMVEQCVPVCQTVMVPVTDCCGNCYNVCRQVVVNKTVMREVCVPVRRTKEVVCDVVVCEAQQRMGKTTVCKQVLTEKVIDVDVTRCVAEPRKVAGTECVMVAKTREVVCKVHSCESRQEVRTRTVYECVPEVVTRRVQCCEMVPYTTVERIPIVVNDCCRPCW